MAKLTGPMFSLAASGSLKKTIVFQGRPSGTAAIKRTIPYDPKNVTQQNIRGYMTLGVDYWQKLPAVYQTQWNNFVL